MLADDVKVCLNDDDVEPVLTFYTLLYDVDTVALAGSAEELQLALNAIDDYCNDLSLIANAAKTKLSFF